MSASMGKYPPSQTPKKLVKQAADKIAYQLFHKFQSVLIHCLFNPDLLGHVSLRNSMIDYLRKLKTDYWDDTGNLLEPYRIFVSDALTDVLEFQFYSRDALPKVKGIHISKWDFPLFTFAAQVLFTYGAGYSSMLDMLKFYAVRSKMSRMLDGFLQAFAPFNLKKLSTAFIRFEDSSPVITLIKNSPHLKHIHLVNNIDYSVFNCLSEHCNEIETVSLKLFPYHVEFTEEGPMPNDFLYRMFFGGQSMEDVVQNINNKEKLVFSFPFLKEVSISNNNINTHIPINGFMLCLQHLYPKIRTTWFNFINIHKPGPQLMQSKFQLPTPFFGRGRYQWDVVEIGYVRNLKILEDEESLLQDVTYPVINHLILEVDAELTHECKFFIENLMKRHDCNNIGLILYRSQLNVVSSGAITSIFSTVGNALQKLYLCLPFELVRNELIAALNVCPFLKVLNIEAIGRIRCSYTTKLNSLSKLDSLSVDIPCSSDKPNDDGLTLKQQLIAAAPHINMIDLSCISGEELEKMIDSGHLSKIHTIQIGSPLPKKLLHFVTRLPSLLLLIVNYEKSSDEWSKQYLHVMKRAFQYTDLRIVCIGRKMRYPLHQQFEFPSN